MPRYTLRALLIVVAAIGCGIGLLRGCYVALTHFETAENVAHVDWLPEAAANVSYYRSYGYTAYEFDMSESEFRRWTRWEMEPITRPVKVNRYSLMTRGQPDLATNPTLDQLEQWEAVGCATVKDGLYYNQRRGNGGGVTVAFDRTKKRVYFQTNPR